MGYLLGTPDGVTPDQFKNRAFTRPEWDFYSSLRLLPSPPTSRTKDTSVPLSPELTIRDPESTLKRPSAGPTTADSGAGIPSFYDYLPGLPNEIDALYQALDKQNLTNIALSQGLYDHIAPDILESYKQSQATNQQRLSEISGLMNQVPGVIEGFLTGEAVDPVIADAIKRAVGLTGSQATLAGAPIQGNTFLTQAATRAATEAAAPIKLGAQQAGVGLLGDFTNMVEQGQLLPFGPQLGGMAAGSMMQQLQAQLLAQRTAPMQARLGMQQQSSNLMGSAINQILAPWAMGAGLGNMWAPFSRTSGGTQTKITGPA